MDGCGVDWYYGLMFDWSVVGRALDDLICEWSRETIEREEELVDLWGMEGRR